MKDDASDIDVLGRLGAADEMLFEFGLKRARAGYARGTSLRRALRASEIS